MRSQIAKQIELECAKLIKRHGDYLHFLDEDTKRKSKRLGVSISKKVVEPRYWALHRGFHPFKVRTRIKQYAHAIDRALQRSVYQPQQAVIHQVPKKDGTMRDVNIFQVPDAAISRLVYKSLLRKNYVRFSSYAYAYREDRFAFDAIKNISNDWRGSSRIYIAEFDYSKFFDNIEHAHLWRLFSRHGFTATRSEQFIVEQFLQSRAAHENSYALTTAPERTRGIPQGTSISLFLANVACYELDLALERLGVGFARYADDTLVWSPDYAKVVRAFEAIEGYGRQMGVPLNMEKSEGVNLLSKGKAEITSKPCVFFLGHSISLDRVSIKPKDIEKIKRRISYLAYQNLVQPLRKGFFNAARLGADVDLDYVVCLYQIRRYMYGGLTTERLLAFLRGEVPSIAFKGVMSFYPLVNDEQQLRALDGWLLATLKNALRAREALWSTKGKSLPGPTSEWIEDIDKLETYDSMFGQSFDLRTPSFLLINQAIAREIEVKGLHAAIKGKALYYS